MILTVAYVFVGDPNEIATNIAIGASGHLHREAVHIRVVPMAGKAMQKDVHAFRSHP